VNVVMLVQTPDPLPLNGMMMCDFGGYDDGVILDGTMKCDFVWDDEV